jgi:hypothetical protein
LIVKGNVSYESGVTSAECNPHEQESEANVRRKTGSMHPSPALFSAC